LERSPEIEKKPMPRSSIPSHVSTYTISKPVVTARTPAIIVPELAPQMSTVSIAKPSYNPYESWKLSKNIPSEAKVFIIAGTYPDVRKALLQRGWFENLDLESAFFDLKWSRNARIPQNLLDWQLYNHFPRNFELSVKWQLYENLKKSSNSGKNGHLTFFPRSFRLDNKGTDDFFEHYKAIYAISMLKDYKNNPSKHIAEQIIVANIVCKRWITEIEKQNYLNNRLSSLVMNVEWKILTSFDISDIKTSFQRLMLSPVSDPYSLTCANLEDLYLKDPQTSITGKKNIWIVKAGRKSRGRDIALFNDINKLKMHTSSSNCWVVQKYIENPLIISNKKFDIRQWVLISNADPLTIWIYKRCYLRFTIEDYNDDNITNPYIHLTNNSITKKSTKFDKASIEGCMWSIDQFKDFLIKEKGSDLWTNKVYPSLKKIVKHSLVAVGNLGRSNSFEILGYDFMIDEDMNPWLLEINSSPAMDYSTVFYI
jgi:tubulin monoglycylase TTLL3/8